MGPARNFAVALGAVLALAGCASGRASLGSVNLRAYGDPGHPQTSYGVQEGRIVSPDLDLVVGADGCISGSLATGMVHLCRQARARPAEAAGNVVQRWAGTGGDFTLELSDAGRSLRADGYLRNGGGGTLPLRTTVPLGQGPQWDELRKHPVLLAVAAGASEITGEPDRDVTSRLR
ncbi:MAG: hypothetical protein NVSMB23_21670 [Myxococcales bacterium]